SDQRSGGWPSGNDHRSKDRRAHVHHVPPMLPRQHRTGFGSRSTKDGFGDPNLVAWIGAPAQAACFARSRTRKRWHDFTKYLEVRKLVQMSQVFAVRNAVRVWLSSPKGRTLSSRGWNPQMGKHQARSGPGGAEPPWTTPCGLGEGLTGSSTVGLRPRLLTVHRFAARTCSWGWGEAPLVS